MPRKPKGIDPIQKVYVDAVRDFLQTKEIKQPKVKIDNILCVDLDGDGEEEVRHYEGGATTIYRSDPKESEALLSVSCGA